MDAHKWEECVASVTNKLTNNDTTQSTAMDTHKWEECVASVTNKLTKKANKGKPPSSSASYNIVGLYWPMYMTLAHSWLHTI
jgi:hypothetical protein